MTKKHVSNQSVQPVEDARILLSELDQIVARRPAGNPVLPPVLCMKLQGKQVSSAQVIPNNYWVSANAGKPAIPHVLSLFDRPEMDDLSLFTYIYENLKLPPSMGQFHFSNLKIALDLLEQNPSPDATNHEAKVNDVVTKLYRKRHPKFASRATSLISTRDGYDGVLGFVAVIIEVIKRTRFKLFRTELATTARYRWFTDRVALELTQNQADEISQDFLSCAVWVLQQPDVHDSSLARELLMLALFEDLEHAFRPRFLNLSWRRRRRTTPFVITLKDVSISNSAARRFLQTFGELIDQSKGASLLVLASVNGQAPASLAADTDTFRTAADKLSLIRQGRYESSAITAFNIQTTATAAQLEEISQLVAKRPTPTPQTNWRDFTLLAVLGIILTPFLLASLIYTVRVAPRLYQSTQSCKYMRAVPRGEVIGITDGSCSFLTRNDARRIGYAETENVFLRQFKIRTDSAKDLYSYITSLGATTPSVLDQRRLSYIREVNDSKGIILTQNRFIREEDPYRTIVLLLPFTSPDESGEANQKTIGILRGMAVAQEEINANADRASPDSLQHLKLKILIANSGVRLSHGQDVAHDIRNLNKNGLSRLTPKHSIVAVAGITQSIAEAKRTVDILTRPGDTDDPAIPVIGSTLTYDYMSGKDPLFYQAAAPNKRQADVMAEFIRHQPLVGDVSGNMPASLKPARNMVVVSGTNDWYSENLADDLYSEFMNNPDGAHTVLAHWSIPGRDTKDVDPHVVHKAEVLPLAAIQSRLCDITKLPTFDQQEDIIVYTGRSQRFSTFLNALKPDVCPRGKGFTILAGSDIAQWGEYDSYRAFFPHLYFGAFGSRGSEHNGAVADHFFANTTVKGVLDQSGSARAYDSIKLIWSIVQGAGLEADRIDTKAIASKFLEKPSIQFEGASGVLSIPAGQRVPVGKPVFMMRAGTSQPVLSCGTFSIQPAGSTPRLNAHGKPFSETKWGSERQFDCPDAAGSL